jgi:hypothetical protein
LSVTLTAAASADLKTAYASEGVEGVRTRIYKNKVWNADSQQFDDRSNAMRRYWDIGLGTGYGNKLEEFAFQGEGRVSLASTLSELAPGRCVRLELFTDYPARDPFAASWSSEPLGEHDCVEDMFTIETVWDRGTGPIAGTSPALVAPTSGGTVFSTGVDPYPIPNGNYVYTLYFTDDIDPETVQAGVTITNEDGILVDARVLAGNRLDLEISRFPNCHHGERVNLEGIKSTDGSPLMTPTGLHDVVSVLLRGKVYCPG